MPTIAVARRLRLLEAQYATFGEPALWYAPLMAPTRLVVRRIEDQDVVDFGASSRTSTTSIWIRVRVSEHGLVAKGDRVEILDEAGVVIDTYRIIDKPLRQRFGLEWRCEAEPSS